MNAELLFSVADESELNELVKGQVAGYPTPWNKRHSPKWRPGTIGVLLKDRKDQSSVVRPVAFVLEEEVHRRFFGRFAQVRENFSPVSAWSHIMSRSQFERLDGTVRNPDLGDMEAAWTGLVIAEALLLAQRSISSLKIAACLATKSFAVARTKALWDKEKTDDIVKRYDTMHDLFRAGDIRRSRIQSALEPIWNSLATVSTGKARSLNQNLKPVERGLLTLIDMRSERRSDMHDEAHHLGNTLSRVVSEAEVLFKIHSMTPEQRVREFDRIVQSLEEPGDDSFGSKKQCLTMLAGYIATVAAGGAPSLSLAEAVSKRWPEITLWAYLVGGIGERIVWTSSFDGLGRLVVRELMRPFHLDEAPACDFAYEEAAVLVDSQLSDPFVHLRIKQARIATVSIFSGVNVLVPMGDQVTSDNRNTNRDVERRGHQNDRLSGSPEDPMSVLADLVWPHLKNRVEGIFRANSTGSRSVRDKSSRATGGKRKPTQNNLPLKDEEKD